MLMPRRIPKQIRITAENERFLKQRAGELGVSESEVVRQALAYAAGAVSMVDNRSHTCDDRPTDALQPGSFFIDVESNG
jgi:hypothetical protein